MFDPATVSTSPRSNTTDCWRRPRRHIATVCPAVAVRERTCETHRRFAFTTRRARLSRSAASPDSIPPSRIPKPARLNWPASSVTRPSKRSYQPRTNILAESASRLNQSAMAKSAELSLTESSPPKSMSPKPGTASPTSPSPAATRCSRSPTDRPISCGGKIRQRLVGNGRWSVSAGQPIRFTSSKSHPAASQPGAGCEPDQRTATCSSWTKTARLHRSMIPPVAWSASPLEIIRLSESEARSKAVVKTNTSSSRSMGTGLGSSTRPSKRCFANQPNDLKPSPGAPPASCVSMEHVGDRSASESRSTTSATTRCWRRNKSSATSTRTPAVM